MAGNVLQDALIYLGTAVVFVPIAKRLGIGSVLGYIIGGIMVGPFLLGLIGTEGEDVMHVAEFGVVMMLFLIGLELNPASFWRMRGTILGMGLMQVAGTALLFFPVLYFGFHLGVNAALALSLTFSMSSTAIVLQTLKEKNLDRTSSGRASFAVLLFQDIAVIPVLAVLPLLAVSKATTTVPEGPASTLPFLDQYPSLGVAAAVIFVFLLSRFLVNPLLGIIARTHMRELFTASALFLVAGVAWLMQFAGISAALGAFMAGVLLANSEYRHELESDILPFKGILLGIFFTAVGSTINFDLIAVNPISFMLTVMGFMMLKAGMLGIIGRIFKLGTEQNFQFALLLSQIGEFGFVLLGSAMALGITDKHTTAYFMAVITASMILSPLLLFIHEKILSRLFVEQEVSEPEYDVQPDEHNRVIIAGFGHFGSTIGRFLRANGVSATILDNDSDRVNLLRKMGFKVFYGDATRFDLLESAGAMHAEILISAIDSPEKNLALCEMVQHHFPHLKIFMRAENRVDAYEFIDKGLTHIYRESFHASIELGIDALSELGLRKYTLRRKAADFIRHDEAALKRLATERHNKESYINSIRGEIAMQERLLSEDKLFTEDRPDNAWDKNLLR